MRIASDRSEGQPVLKAFSRHELSKSDQARTKSPRHPPRRPSVRLDGPRDAEEFIQIGVGGPSNSRIRGRFELRSREAAGRPNPWR